MRRTSRDRAVIVICLFFVAVASTVELWWVRHASHLPAQQGWLAGAFSLYVLGDRGYYDQVGSFEISLETFHVYATQVFYVVLIAATLRGVRWRFPLQLCVGAYVAYSVMLYFAAKHMTGYVETPVHDLPSFLMLIVPNLPWLFASLFLALDAGAEIARAVALSGGARP